MTKHIERTAEIVTTKNKENVIKITFPFNETDLTNIRTLKNRKWLKNSKCWTASLCTYNVKNLIVWKFILGPKITDWYKGKIKQKQNHITEIKIPTLKGTLFQYQKEGVLFLENKNGRGLIADEMGLGKTVQALAWLELHKEARKTLIVCPASLKINWSREAEKWMSEPNVQILNGTDINAAIYGDILIINYDILKYWKKVLNGLDLKCIIMDESHYIKNNKAERTKCAKQICKGVPYVVMLSGTPIENKTYEIYNAVNIIDNTLFPDLWGFKMKYCAAKHNGFGWDFSGASNTQELNKILTENVMIRRKKKDVLKDLPDKVYSYLPFTLSNEAEYNKAEQNFVQYIRNKTELEIRETFKEMFNSEYGELVEFKDHKLEKLKDEKVSKINILTQIEMLKQIAVKGKLNSIFDWVDDFLESDEKLVIFAIHKEIIDALMQRYKKLAVKVDGTVSILKRQKAVDEFQENKKIKIFVGNIKAAGVGLTLTAASNVLFLEYPWTPGQLQQAVDRCHRITQKDVVNAYFSMAVNTIEEKIVKMLNKKQQIADAVLDGADEKDSNILNDLIKTYM